MTSRSDLDPNNFLRIIDEQKRDLHKRVEELQREELDLGIEEPKMQKTEQPLQSTNKFKQLYQTLLAKGEETFKCLTHRVP